MSEIALRIIIEASNKKKRIFKFHSHRNISTYEYK